MRPAATVSSGQLRVRRCTPRTHHQGKAHAVTGRGSAKDRIDGVDGIPTTAVGNIPSLELPEHDYPRGNAKAKMPA